MNKNSYKKNRITLTSIAAALLINIFLFVQLPVIPSFAAGSTTPTKITGYLFDADTMAPITGVQVELNSLNATVTPMDTTTDSNGFYEFDFTSESQVYDSSTSTDLYLQGQLSVSDATYKAEYTVSYTDAGNYNDATNQEVHERVYIYKNRVIWNDSSLHQYYVLIPPGQVPLSTEINAAETPLLLVHGHGGGGNYWEGVRKLIATSGYSSQVWEVFYPSDGRIIEMADIVKDAVNTLLLNYDVDHQQVDMVGHSEGGPVTLAYIQGLGRYPYDAAPVSYTPHVRKLLQLSPANHGSIHASRLIADAINGTTSCTTKIFNQVYPGEDPLQPAYQDMALGSQFMQELFTSIDNSGLGLDPSNMLVITGTDSNIFTKFPLLLFGPDCAPGKGQNDVFVSASSASLLNFSVPLGLVYLDHSETRGTQAIDPNNTGQSDYPETPAQAQPLVDMIGNFFAGNTATVRNNLDLYIDPSSAPLDPTQYQIYESGVLQSSPLGADQWNDGQSTTYFDRGSLWISAVDSSGSPLPDDIWITDGDLYYKMYQSAAGVFYIDSLGTVNSSGTPVTRTETHYGEIAPAGSFGKTYSAFVPTTSGNIPLGDVTISPVTTNIVDLTEITISGYVQTGAGDGISGVVLNGLPGNPVTDSTGFYQSLVPPDWSGTVVPEKTGYTFSPSGITYSNVVSDQTNQDYLQVFQVFLPLMFR